MGLVGGVILGIGGGLYNLVRQSLRATREAKPRTTQAERQWSAVRSQTLRADAAYARFLGLAVGTACCWSRVGLAADAPPRRTRAMSGDGGRLRHQRRRSSAGRLA